ncbi:hypothetical protein PTSG_06660 [Salpingoeca rosetta]|uniref:Uncharacterized protein n=1 Tax=Salpingoeca rosetta (strain ATCC 50818 / BSB-021) TaxID=946362 RepID=F2UFM4_SALR5|nr:uncharacterized protein PTSG_06660 [Salpingoeca rosetta]EGD75592.1 hypothetical protein PTSG_06660 [Salpingoeca rosetta]|eukprot:XP_004992049.1 hypothetical protein PTSG_06660 [Salpingoeca rosetta]
MTSVLDWSTECGDWDHVEEHNIQVSTVMTKEMAHPIFFHANEEAHKWLRIMAIKRAEERRKKYGKEDAGSIDDEPTPESLQEVFAPIIVSTHVTEAGPKQEFYYGITPSGHSIVMREFDGYQFLIIDGTLPPQWLERKIVILYDLIRMLHGGVAALKSKDKSQNIQRAARLGLLLEKAAQQLRTQQRFLVDAHLHVAKHMLTKQVQSALGGVFGGPSGGEVSYAFVMSKDMVIANYTKRGAPALTKHDVHLLSLFAQTQLPHLPSEPEREPVSRTATTPRTSFLTPDHVEANLSEDRSFLDASAVLSHQHVRMAAASRNTSLRAAMNASASAANADDSHSGPTTTTTFETCETTLDHHSTTEAHTIPSEAGSHATAASSKYEADASDAGSKSTSAGVDVVGTAHGGDSGSQHGSAVSSGVSRGRSSDAGTASDGGASSARGSQRGRSSNSGGGGGTGHASSASASSSSASSSSSAAALSGTNIFLHTADGTKDHYVMYVQPITQDAHLVVIRPGNVAEQMARVFKLWDRVVHLVAATNATAPYFEDHKNTAVLVVRGGLETADSILSVNGDYYPILKDRYVHNGRTVYQHENKCTHMFHDAKYGGWVISPTIADGTQEWIARCKDPAVEPDLTREPWHVRGYDDEEVECKTMALCAFNANCCVRVAPDAWTPFTPCGGLTSTLSNELIDVLVQVYLEHHADVIAREERTKKLVANIRATKEVLTAVKRWLTRDYPKFAAKLECNIEVPTQPSNRWTMQEFEGADSAVNRLYNAIRDRLFGTFVSRCLKSDTTLKGKAVQAVLAKLSIFLQPVMLESLRASANADPYRQVRLKYPGLVHFLFVNRSKDMLYCSPLPDIRASSRRHDSTSDDATPQSVLKFIPDFKDQLWAFYLEARDRLVHGFTTYSSKQTSLRFLYTVWFESNGDRLLPPANTATQAAFRELGRNNSAGSTAFKALTKQLFPEWKHEVVCFEMCYVSLSFFPIDFVCEQATALAKEIRRLHE